MPLRSLRWIRPSAGASWARADGATAAVAVAAVVGLMNARRVISYGAVITLPLELDDSRLIAASYHPSWTRASSQSSPRCALRSDTPTLPPGLRLTTCRMARLLYHRPFGF